MVRIIMTAAVLGAGALAACNAAPPGTPLADTPAASEVSCREMLIQPSNVPRTYCATGAEWAEYEAEQRRATRESMRRMTDGPIAGPDNSPVNIPY